jgi:ribosomal protein L7Ae-like RNA K-turn-binding protein
MSNKIFSMLGLAKKAGKLLSGSDVCEHTIKSGKAALVIISSDSSDGTNKKFHDMCSYRRIPCRVFGDRYSLGKCTGKDERVVAVLIDKGFSDVILKMIDESLLNGGE